MKYDVVALYVCIDDFSKIYEEWERKKLIRGVRNRMREGKLSMGEQLLIVILYHLEGYNGLKKPDNKKVFLFPKRCKNKI